MTKDEFIKQNIVDLLFCFHHGAGSLYFGDLNPVDFVRFESEAGSGDKGYDQNYPPGHFLLSTGFYEAQNPKKQRFD